MLFLILSVTLQASLTFDAGHVKTQNLIRLFCFIISCSELEHQPETLSETTND